MNVFVSINLGKFCHNLLNNASRWKQGTTLVEVIKAVVKHLDEPDPDYAITYGKNICILIFFIGSLSL